MPWNLIQFILPFLTRYQLPSLLWFLAPKVIFVLSTAGTLFLGSIGRMLQTNSPYLDISGVVGNSHKTKPQLAHSVFAAMFMYFSCAVVSGYFIFTSRKALPKDRRSVVWIVVIFAGCLTECPLWTLVKDDIAVLWRYALLFLSISSFDLICLNLMKYVQLKSYSFVQSSLVDGSRIMMPLLKYQYKQHSLDRFRQARAWDIARFKSKFLLNLITIVSRPYRYCNSLSIAKPRQTYDNSWSVQHCQTVLQPECLWIFVT